MELSPDQQAEVTDVLTKHPIGIRYKSLWDKCKTFESERELSQCLHRMTQLGLIFKKTDCYFKIGVVPPEHIEPEPPKRRAAKPVIVQYNEDTDEAMAGDSGDDIDDADSEEDLEAAKASPTNKKMDIEIPVYLKSKVDAVPDTPVKVKKEGTNPRTKSAGGSLLALYKCRGDRPLTLSDLEFFTGASRTTLYAAMQRAISAGYVSQDKSGKYALFKWSDEYKYPFDKWKATDERLLSKTYKEWQVKEGIASKVGMPVDDEETEEQEEDANEDSSGQKTCEDSSDESPLGTIQAVKIKGNGNGSIKATLDHIDHQIKIHEAQLATLRSVKLFITNGSAVESSQHSNTN